MLLQSLLGAFRVLYGRGRLPSLLLLLRLLHAFLVDFLVLYHWGRRLLGVQALLHVALLLPLNLLPVVLLLLVLLAVLDSHTASHSLCHSHCRLVSVLAVAVAVAMAVVVQKMMPLQVVAASAADALARQVAGSFFDVAGLQMA